jgi:hypothetical protein
MVQLNPPICKTSDDHRMCMQVIKDVYNLRYEIIFAEEMQKNIQKNIDKLENWKENRLDSTYWDNVATLVESKKKLDLVEKDIAENTKFNEKIRYKDLIKILTNDNVIKRVAVDLNVPEATPEQIADMYSYDGPSSKSKSKFGHSFGEDFDTRKDLKDLSKTAKELSKQKRGRKKDSRIKDITKSVSKKLKESLRRKEKDTKLVKNEARVQIALGQSIVQSIVEESRDIKLLNKQYDLDIEELKQNKINTGLYCENQMNIIDGQLEVFNELQRSNIESLSKEIKSDFKTWKRVLGSKTLASLIEYSNLLSTYLFNLNKVELNNPTETNVTQLVTYFTQEGMPDQNVYVEEQKAKVNKEIDKLKDFKGEWEQYFLESRKVLFELMSDRESVVKNGLEKIVTELEQLKPTIDIDDVKTQSKRNKDVMLLKDRIAKVKAGIANKTIDKQAGQKFIKDSEDQIIGVGGDLSDFDMFDKLERARIKVERSGKFKEKYTEIEKDALRTQIDKSREERDVLRKELDLFKGDILAGTPGERVSKLNTLKLFLQKEAMDIDKKLADYIISEKIDEYVEKETELNTTLESLKDKLPMKETDTRYIKAKNKVKSELEFFARKLAKTSKNDKVKLRKKELEVKQRKVERLIKDLEQDLSKLDKAERNEAEKSAVTTEMTADTVNKIEQFLKETGLKTKFGIRTRRRSRKRSKRAISIKNRRSRKLNGNHKVKKEKKAYRSRFNAKRSYKKPARSKKRNTRTKLRSKKRSIFK